jgi:gamma-glutamylcyclotransferase (GGCT)/AIG2-like uncharacterized protein YtfP
MDAGRNSSLNLAASVDEKPPPPPSLTPGAQLHGFFHPRILAACNALRHWHMVRSRSPFIGLSPRVDYSFYMHVFTYGTLMFPEVWQAVVGREFATVQATASGYAIYRVRDAVFPGIIAAGERDMVRGVVYLEVDPASIARLDLFEDDFYCRESLWLTCADGERRAAEAYVVPEENRRVLTNETWHADRFVASGGLDTFIRRFEGFGRLSTSGGD